MARQDAAREVDKTRGPVERGPDAAADHEAAIARALRQIDDQQVRWLRVACADLHGVLRAKLVPAGRAGRVLREGQAWGVRLLHVDLAEHLDPETEYDTLTHVGNCRMVPDPATFRVLPWQPDTAVVFADPTFDGGNAAPSARGALKALLARAAGRGYGAQAGSEIEFHLYRREPRGLVPVTDDRAFFSARGLARSEPILRPLREALDALGLPLYSIENEHGAGQLELNLGPLPALDAADAACLARAAIKEVADRHGYLATFIARPDNGAETNTCGYHLHQALYAADGSNSFWDPADPDGVAPALRQYVAGQLAHAPALVACASPTVSGYVRYLPGTFAPVTANWGFDDRGALVRVMRDRGQDTRIENRLGEAAANPYLLLASQLAAGLDGVRHQAAPPSPLGQDRGGAVAPSAPLPRDVPEAVAALRADGLLVDWLGIDMIRAYTGAMISAWRRYQAWVSDWEVAEYRETL